jgi:intracellular sulfur oxidation DsrE/DsrF family protein
MRRIALACAVTLAMAGFGTGGEARADGIVVDVPVKLDAARVVLNLDHAVFAGDEPVGFDYLRVFLDRFAADGTKSEIVAIFHGAFGYALLDDAKYNEVRHWTGGNPYKVQVLAAIAAGVSVEECAQTMRDMGWTNADLIPGVRVNTGANFRIIELVQDGFVQIQP